MRVKRSLVCGVLRECEYVYIFEFYNFKVQTIYDVFVVIRDRVRQPPARQHAASRNANRKQAGLLGAGAPITLFKLKRAVFDTEKGQLFYN
jgi:hypothetical protein